jgi:membrane fusion protein (multidrug efflux system)
MENTAQKAPAKRIMPIVAAIVILGLIYFIGSKVMYSMSNEDTENAQLESAISPIVSRISGYVTALKVVENQQVKKGDTLFIIDDRDLKLKVQQAEIALKSSEANLELVKANVAISGSAVTTSHANVETGSASVESANAGAESAAAGLESANASIAIANASVETANGNVEAAKIKVWKATQDFNRYADLLTKKSVTQQQYDNAKAEKEGADAQLSVAEKQLNVARKQVELAQKQANVVQKQAEVAQKQANVSKKQTGSSRAQEDAAKTQQTASSKQIGVAEVLVEQRRSELEFAKLQLSYCYVLSPIDGAVSKKNIQLGQLVNAGAPLFSIVDESSIWVVANFKETQIERMKVGDKVTLKVDAFPKEKFEGEIESMSAATGAKFALLPPDNASGNFVKVVQRVPVKIIIKAKEDKTKLLRAGMNVKVVVPV